MATVNYQVKTNEASVISMFRQLIADDGVTVLSEEEVSMQEVRNVSPGTVDTYLEQIADKLDDLSSHLRGVDQSPSDVTYLKSGTTYKTLEALVKNFDRSLLPPSDAESL